MAKKKLLRTLAGIVITAEDAGKLLAKTRQWIERLVAKGYLKPIEQGFFRPGDVVRAQVAHMAAAHQRAAQSGGGSLAAVQSARAREIEQRIEREDRGIVELRELIEVNTEVIADLRDLLAGLGARVTDDAVMRDAIDGRINDALGRATDRLARLVAQLRTGGAAVDDADVEPQEE